MGYRDELGAAQARADAASRALEEEKAARGDDVARIAELEGSLAASLEELAALRDADEESPQAAPAKQGTMAAVVVGAVLVMGFAGAGSYFMLATSPDMPPNFGDEVFAPAAPEFDVSEQLSVAKRAATRHFGGNFRSGPFLKNIVAKAVDDEGRNHLKFGGVSYDFVVELEAMPLEQDDGPVGTRKERQDTRKCRVTIHVNSDGIKYPSEFTAGIRGIVGFGPCEGPGITPRCTVAEIRKRSLADGAPKGAMAEVSISVGRVWQVSIVDQGRELFSRSYPDDCGQ